MIVRSADSTYKAAVMQAVTSLTGGLVKHASSSAFSNTATVNKLNQLNKTQSSSYL